MQAQQWIAVSGQIEVQNGVVTFVPKVAEDAAEGAKRSTAEAKSNIDFQGGVVDFEVRTHEPDARCQVVLTAGKGTDVHIGLFVGSSAYGIGLYKNNTWEYPKTVGYGTRPPVDEWIRIRVQVVGSTIALYSNGVKLCEHDESIQKGQIGLYFAGTQKIEVRNIVVDTVLPSAFVVMQFSPEYNALFTDVIKPTFEEFGYRVVRGDDASLNGMIVDDISRAIREASVVIADITPDNPNVFYEVGFAHALGKPTILLSDRRREKLPFDVSGFRTLFYDNTIGGKSAVESKLRQHLRAIAA